MTSFQDGHVGLINFRMNLAEVIEKWSNFVQQITEDRWDFDGRFIDCSIDEPCFSCLSNRYGHSPSIRISGHVSSRFPYIEMPLDYILPELLKNAVRATIESHQGLKGSALPPVTVNIASNEVDFVIKWVHVLGNFRT